MAKLKYDKSLLMQRWRRAGITYLRAAHEAGLLRTKKTASQLEQLSDIQEGRWWSIDIAHFTSKDRFLRYAGRYVRRPPIAE